MHEIAILLIFKIQHRGGKIGAIHNVVGSELEAKDSTSDKTAKFASILNTGPKIAQTMKRQVVRIVSGGSSAEGVFVSRPTDENDVVAVKWS